MPLIGGNFVELRDCVFIKGFPSNSDVSVSEVRKYFEERVGECCVQMTALSKDKRWSFVTLKFDSAAIAEKAIERFDGKYICGHKVQMNFWRLPKNVAHSGRFDRNSTNNTNSRRWDDKSSFEDATEKSTRHTKDDYLREKNNWNANHKPRDTVRRNEKEELSEDPDNFRGYQECNFPERYNTSEDFSYQSEEYLPDHWSSDGGEERAYSILDGNCNGWDSDFSGDNETLSEREYYQRDEEFPYPDDKDVWQESGVDRAREQDFADQDDPIDYQGHLPEYESYPELYEGSLKEEECDNSRYNYSEGPFEDIEDESPYRGEDLCTSNNREWYSDREYSDRQDSQDRDQEDNQSSFSSFDQTRQWPRWEKVSPNNPTRRRLSDPEVTEDTPKHTPWAENPRPCNKLKDLTGRNPAAFSEERPRSDGWLRNTHRHFRDRGRHSTSPVNLRPKVYGHRGSPLVEDTSKASSEISYNSAHSRRGRCSISPAKDRHSNRGSSEEKSADFKLCGTSPGSERSSYSFKEQGLERRKRESRSYSPNPNTKLPWLRGRSYKSGNVGRRGNDLRRSLMLQQQRKHSLLRERDREEGVRHSERATKTSPDKPGKSHNSAESSSTTQGMNRKRRKCDDEKRRDNTETTKRRRQTSLNNSDYKTGNGDSTRNKGIKVKGESRKQPPRHQKGKTRQQRHHVTDNSNTKRTDRLLKDLAVTLAEDNISLRRPEEKLDAAKADVNSVARKSVGSVRGRKSKPTGQSGQSKGRLKQEKRVALAKENLQTTLDTVEDVKCGKVTDESWSTIEGASEGEMTTPEVRSQLTVPCSDDSSDQDKNNVAEFDDSTNLSTENLDNTDHYVNAEKSTQPDKVSSDNHDFLEIKKNCTFIVDIFENTDVLEVNEHDLRSCSAVSEGKSKMDLIEKVVEEENSVLDNCCADQNELPEEPDHNPDYFSLYQSHMQEMKVHADVDTPNETMSANLQHVPMEISPTEENPPQLDVGEETCPPGGITVYEDDRKEPGISVSYMSENSLHGVQRDISSPSEFSLRNSRPKEVLKTPSVNPLEDKGNKNVSQKEMQETSHSYQDMEFSSDDTLSGVLHSNKVLYNPVKLYNTGNTVVDRGEEEYIMSSIKEKANVDVTNTEHKTSEVGSDGFSVTTTETTVFSNEVSVDASKQGRYNMGELKSTMEEEECDASYSGKELCDSKNADIDGNSDGNTDVTSTVLDVHELDGAMNYFKCQEKVICPKEDVYVLEDAEVTQRDVYGEKDVTHVYNSSSEWCNDDDAVLEATSTEQGLCSASGNEAQQKIYNQVGVSDDGNSNREDDNMKDVVDIKQEHCEMEFIDVKHREEGTGGDISISKGEENDSENSRFDAFNTEQEARGSEDVVNNATHERDSSKSFDLDLTSEDQKCDVQDHKVNYRKDGCVTQQEVFSHNVIKGSHGIGNGGVYAKDTEQKSFHLDPESSNIVHAQVTHEILNTEDPRCNTINSIQKKGVHGTTAEGNPIHIGTRYSCWTSLESCHSKAALTQYSPISDVGAANSSASSLNNSFIDSCVRESHHLVAEELEPVDMEISSEDEHHDHRTGSSICVNTETSAKDDDACRPYSPGSPTWRSDEHRSPPPKLDISLYSPSHPTNVSSEGDVEQSITVEDISYEHDERQCDAPIQCSTMEVVCCGEPQNSLRSSKADEEAKTNNGDGTGDGSTSSFRFSSSPKSGTELFQHISLADDFSETNLPTKDPTQNRNETTNNEKGEKREKDSALCTDDPATARISKDDLKPLMRCQTRTQSLPILAPSTMDAKPKIIYVTAAKTYDLYTDNGAQHKPRIFYATNDKAAGPARSLSLDTTLGKSWTLDENSPLGSNNTPAYCEQQPALETTEPEKRTEEKDPNEPLFHDGSFISEAPLEPSKDTTEDGDQEVITISAPSDSARSDDIAMLPAVEGPGNCADCGVTGSISSVVKESARSSINSDDNILLLGSTSEKEMSLVSKMPLQLRPKDVPTEHSRSTDRTPKQITEGGFNWDISNLRNMSCGSDETPVTSEVTDKRLLASESEGCGFGLRDEGTSLLKSSVQAESTVSEEEGGNEKYIQSEFICSEIQQQVLPLKTVQTLSNSPPRSAYKRTYHDSTTEASRLCKVPRKPLKLIIPANQPSNREVKRTANRGYLGRHSKKTSTCTITRADVDLVPETNSSSCILGDGSAITELYTADKDAMIAENGSSSENGELMYTLSPAISRMDGSESNSPSISDSLPPTSTTGNTSPLTAHLSPYNQTPTSAENNNIKEHMAQSCGVKESDWVTVKMERLQKKKDEIEQVYKKECHTVVNVVKMLVSNDPRLEGLLQNAVRRSLQEMGRRCVQELVKQTRPGT